MVARRLEFFHQEDGQSVVEFLVLLPVLVGMAAFLIKVQTAIQVSIVNQQYARAQALFLTYNSPVYPELRLRSKFPDDQMMYLGVSDNVAPRDSEGDYIPEASTQKLVRPGQSLGNNEDKREDVNQRGQIRIRTTVSLCLPMPGEPSEQVTHGYCRSPFQ